MCRMKKNLRTRSILSASAPSMPSMCTKFSTRPNSGLRGLSSSGLPPLSRNSLAINSGIRAIRFIESDLASPDESAAPRAIMPIANQSIGWPLPGVRDSSTLSAPVGISSARWANSALNAADSSSVGNLLFIRR